jgi:predicted neuraminidase
MSHSITLFNELSLTSKLLILVNYSTQTNTKIRIRKSDILTKSLDTSGYKLGEDNKLSFLENHLKISPVKERIKTTQFLSEIKQIQLKSKIKIYELQKSKKLNQSRMVTTKLDYVKI